MEAELFNPSLHLCSSSEWWPLVSEAKEINSQWNSCVERHEGPCFPLTLCAALNVLQGFFFVFKDTRTFGSDKTGRNDNMAPAYGAVKTSFVDACLPVGLGVIWIAFTE